MCVMMVGTGFATSLINEDLVCEVEEKTCDSILPYLVYLKDFV